MPNPLAHIHNYTEPNWKPLERAVSLAGMPAETVGEFMWMCENPKGNHQYKNRDTRHYVHLRGNETATACVKGLASAMAITWEVRQADMTQPYKVRTSCGHIVTRRMRPATAGVPFTPDIVIEAPNGALCPDCHAGRMDQ